MIKVLNLYAGIGGNRKLWEDVEITAVEIDPKIAKIYQDFYTDDTVIVGDAHQYLLDNFKEFDFIWSSPPCPTHSKFRIAKPTELVYPDMALYQEIIILQRWCKCPWIIENVVGYYEPLIEPKLIQRHYVWSNFWIEDKEFGHEKIRGTDGLARLTDFHDINIDGCDYPDKRKLLRNCVYPPLGKHIFDCAFNNKEQDLKEWL